MMFLIRSLLALALIGASSPAFSQSVSETRLDLSLEIQVPPFGEHPQIFEPLGRFSVITVSRDGQVIDTPADNPCASNTSSSIGMISCQFQCGGSRDTYNYVLSFSAPPEWQWASPEVARDHAYIPQGLPVQFRFDADKCEIIDSGRIYELNSNLDIEENRRDYTGRVLYVSEVFANGECIRAGLRPECTTSAQPLATTDESPQSAPDPTQQRYTYLSTVAQRIASDPGDDTLSHVSNLQWIAEATGLDEQRIQFGQALFGADYLIHADLALLPLSAEQVNIALEIESLNDYRAALSGLKPGLEVRALELGLGGETDQIIATIEATIDRSRIDNILGGQHRFDLSNSSQSIERALVDANALRQLEQRQLEQPGP